MPTAMRGLFLGLDPMLCSRVWVFCINCPGWARYSIPSCCLVLEVLYLKLR